MPLIQGPDQGRAQALSRVVFCNPFMPERIELEREILGEAFEAFFPFWHLSPTVADENPNVVRIGAWAESFVDDVRARMLAGEKSTTVDRSLYRDACLYALYHRYRGDFHQRIVRAETKGSARSARFFAPFEEDVERYFGVPGIGLPEGQSPAHLFACFYQIRRAFHHIFRSMAGSSAPSARLRARVWQSIFTHDLRLYQTTLFDRMGDVTTLITGPSGVGKELVARAIGLSRYIPFDTKSHSFRESPEASFHALNLPALSPTLIESELFGHKRGAFTGAVADRRGWLAACPPFGTVFLDEIGEVGQEIQVKLLRVIETRRFQPLGTTTEHEFRGKFVTATNQNLAAEMRAGRFREDLFYRLCADTIAAPPLRERLDDHPEELGAIVAVLAHRIVGEKHAGALAAEAERWIEAHLGEDYTWPGNVRELLQCVNNVMIHRDYRPIEAADPAPRARLSQAFLEGDLSADDLLTAYCTLVYARLDSYVGAARRLGLDRRTVKAHVDATLLDELRRSGTPSSS